MLNKSSSSKTIKRKPRRATTTKKCSTSSRVPQPGSSLALEVLDSEDVTASAQEDGPLEALPRTSQAESTTWALKAGRNTESLVCKYFKFDEVPKVSRCVIDKCEANVTGKHTENAVGYLKTRVEQWKEEEKRKTIKKASDPKLVLIQKKLNYSVKKPYTTGAKRWIKRPSVVLFLHIQFLLQLLLYNEGYCSFCCGY